MSRLEEKIQIVKNHINDYPDFPKPGVLFRDIFSVFEKPEVVSAMHDVLLEFSKRFSPVECVAALDARGFLLGPLIALKLRIPFVPIRKKGKLPGGTIQQSYSLEYGNDTLEIQDTGIAEGKAVLIVDDLLATGGSLGAACALIENIGGTVAGCLVLMELTELNGREKISTEVLSVIKY